MPRRLRYIAKPATLVETTCRVIQGRELLHPSRLLNEIIIGTLAVAKERYGVRIVCAVVLSNHFHLLLVVDDAKQLSRFQGFICSKIAREVGRLTGWKEKVWGRRYSGIIVSDEPEAQIARLKYLLSHGVKENLVTRCSDWPGVHASQSQNDGQPLLGYWFDRTEEFKARRRGENPDTYAFAKPKLLSFDPLPCWQHLQGSEYRDHITEMITSIETEAFQRKTCEATTALGERGTRPLVPRATPRTIKRTPIPLVHAASRAVRRAFQEAYRLFVLAYRIAAEQLRASNSQASFPAGCFPPALAFRGL